MSHWIPPLGRADGWMTVIAYPGTIVVGSAVMTLATNNLSSTFYQDQTFRHFI